MWYQNTVTAVLTVWWRRVTQGKLAQVGVHYFTVGVRVSQQVFRLSGLMACVQGMWMGGGPQIGTFVCPLSLNEFP